MNIHEYPGPKYWQNNGVAVPKGIAADECS